MITYSFLQHYWWFIISLLGALLVFLLFIQGGQTLISSLSRNDKERMVLVNAMGRKWEYTFTTLVTFGGAFFASFPLFYSTSFGGAYWVWMAILFCFVLQAVSYEYRSKPKNLLGKKVYDGFLYFNGMAGPFLIGVAVATFFTGSEFFVDKGNLALFHDIENVTISRWASGWHGLEALANPLNWALGLAVLFLSRTLACLYFVNRLADENLLRRARKSLLFNALPFLICFLTFLIWILASEGYAVNPETKEVYLASAKYLDNLLAMPIVAVVFLSGVVLVLAGIGLTMRKAEFKKGIWLSGIGTVLTVCMLLLLVGYNNTPFYPSSIDLNSSLTIENASSSEYTLTIMAAVSLLVPFVLAYIVYAWGVLERKPFKAEDLKDDGHVY